MSDLNKIPVTVVTGFLGAGKTTLIRHLMQNPQGKRLGVVVNEFGTAGVDGDILKSCADENCPENNIVELANGCICCTVEEEFLPVMEQLVARRDDIDHILIETSGLALPKPLVQAFNWPGIKEHCTVDAVITVLDGPAVADGRFAHDEAKVQAQRLADESLDHDPSLKELLEDQLSAADLVVVSKNDLLDTAQRQAVEQVVEYRVPASVKTTYISNGEAQLDVLMGIGAAAEERIDQVHNHHDHHHAHGEEHDHAHDHFDSFVISLGEVDAEKLQQQLQQLLADFNIYRAKGFAAQPGKPMRQVIQAVGERLDSWFDRLWAADESRLTQLVFIGKGIEKAQIEAVLKTAEV